MSNARTPALECWLPALSRFDAASPWRNCIARADRLPPGPVGYLDGLAGYFHADGGLPAAALTRDYLHGDAGDALWLSADPAWVQPDLTGVRLLACGRLGLSMDEAQALAAPLKPLFGDAGMLLAASPLPAFAAPEQAMGEDLFEHLPQGIEGRRWRILLNEVQVLLHQHPLNAERRERGLPPINSVWLWGGGKRPAYVRSEVAGVIGDDLLLRALASRAGAAVHARDVDAIAAVQAGWLIDLQDLPANELDASWWMAVQTAIAKQPMRLTFASGERWLYKPWHRLRFWRGTRR